MTTDELKQHLAMHPLFVVERSTSRNGIPSIVSFYVIVDGQPARIDDVVVELLRGVMKSYRQGQFTLIDVGRVKAATIHDPYIHTLEEHLANLSKALFGKDNALKYTVL